MFVINRKTIVKDVSSLSVVHSTTFPTSIALLHHISHGESEIAKRLIENDTELLLKKATFTENFSDSIHYPHRTFEDITALQLACWYLDKHMWEMIVKLFIENGLVDQASKQIKEIESKPTYVKIHGMHYDYTPIIEAYQRYIQFCIDNDNATEWCANTMKKAGELWRVIGEIQRGFPNAIISEYTRADRSFFPIPKFDEETLPRHCEILDVNSNQRIKWHAANLGQPVLEGKSVCTSRIFRGALEVAWNGCALRGARTDLDALMAYRNIRLNNFAQLKQFLAVPD